MHPLGSRAVAETISVVHHIASCAQSRKAKLRSGTFQASKDLTQRHGLIVATTLTPALRSLLRLSLRSPKSTAIGFRKCLNEEAQLSGSGPDVSPSNGRFTSEDHFSSGLFISAAVYCRLFLTCTFEPSLRLELPIFCKHTLPTNCASNAFILSTKSSHSSKFYKVQKVRPKCLKRNSPPLMQCCR